MALSAAVSIRRHICTFGHSHIHILPLLFWTSVCHHYFFYSRKRRDYTWTWPVRRALVDECPLGIRKKYSSPPPTPWLLHIWPISWLSAMLVTAVSRRHVRPFTHRSLIIRAYTLQSSREKLGVLHNQICCIRVPQEEQSWQ